MSKKNLAQVKSQAQKVAIRCRSPIKQVRATGKDKTDMRNILKIFVVLGIASALTACAPSLHPFFTDRDVVFNEALLGVWIDDSGETCKFTKSGDDHYEFLIMDEKPMRFEARLIDLGGVTFLDLYPKPIGDQSDLYPESFVPAHRLARVTIGMDSFSIAMMDGDWLKRLSDRNQLDLKHERINDDMIALTASTKELQAFALKHADSEDAFGKAEVFHRLRSDK